METRGHPSGETDIVRHLDRITDLPAAVSFIYGPRGRLFHTPERALEAIATKHVVSANICAERKAKYQARGYTIDE